jgi:tRNA A37 threonylcarbamoyltransferase TsaD
VAVVTTSGRILGESLATQAEIHAAWGGVVPKLAQEAHEAAIDGCVEEALAAAGITADQLDAVAVTIGPGLSLCLRVGVLKAHQLAAVHGLPLIPVHHMEAHALVARLGGTPFAAAAAAEQAAQEEQAAQQGAAAAAASFPGSSGSNSGAPEAAGDAAAPAATAAAAVEFPFLCLLISGGHNLLLLVEGIGQYTQLGTTLDDALGKWFACLPAYLPTCPPACLTDCFDGPPVSQMHACAVIDQALAVPAAVCHHPVPYLLFRLPASACAGEAYDKVARLLGLDLNPSGGAALEAFAQEGDPSALPFSVPMQRRPTCDFSYAGLKTAVRLAIEERAPEPTGGWVGGARRMGGWDGLQCCGGAGLLPLPGHVAVQVCMTAQLPHLPHLIDRLFLH